MLRTVLACSLAVSAIALLTIVAGCSRTPTENQVAISSTQTETVPPSDRELTGSDASAIGAEEHGHASGTHGGTIVSLGRDSYHVEAIVTSTGELRLYTLGSDETRVLDIDIQDLVAYVKPSGGTDSTSLQLKAQPQTGDASGKSSLFIAQLPETLVGTPIDIAVPNITINGERFRLSFTTQNEGHGTDSMPTKVADDAERELYLTPGGIYTLADIEANGKVTASQKFKGFMAKHDMHPKTGDTICPVTMTKANPACTWIVAGQKYEFCCPPCVDEFVSWAKDNELVKDIKQPEEYVKK